MLPRRYLCKFFSPFLSQIIVLHFDVLETERSETCTFDVVKIYDSRDISSSPEAVFCNGLPDSDYVSTRNVLYVVFTSDSSFTDRGFSITYTSHKVDPQPALPEQSRKYHEYHLDQMLISNCRSISLSLSLSPTGDIFKLLLH